MRNANYFRNKKVTIVGLARSGLACANLLYDLGAQVWITDNQNNAQTQENSKKLKSKEIKVELGKHTTEFIKEKDLIVVSPGVAENALPLLWGKQFHLPIISEIEAAWMLCPSKVIAVTGTNGKTTVTTLIGKILEADGKNVFVCGNIGTPFAAGVDKMQEGDFVCLEVSSFQLEKIQTFKPKIAMILNFSRNHLDRYHHLQEYLEAKKRIFMNQDKEDYLVLNYNDAALGGLSQSAKSQIVYFSQESGLNSNQAAVLAVAGILGIERSLVLQVFKDFKGVEHRLEYVAEIEGVKFINDSKSTTVDSTIWALDNLAYPVILIAGGREKGNDYSLILELVRKRVKEMVLIGEAKGKIRQALGGYLVVHDAASLEEALQLAFNRASPGDQVLLSPMCKSFDMFSNYEERGNVFKKAVRDLARSKNSVGI